MFTDIWSLMYCLKSSCTNILNIILVCFQASKLGNIKTDFNFFFLFNFKSNQTYMSKTTESIKISVGFQMVCIGRKISYDLNIGERFYLGRKKTSYQRRKDLLLCVDFGNGLWAWPVGGQSCLHITLTQCHCELVDRLFCNCSQVSQYMNILSCEPVKIRIFITFL